MKDDGTTRTVTSDEVGSYCDGLEKAIMEAIKKYGTAHHMGFASTFIATVLGQVSAKTWRHQYADEDIPKVVADMARVGLADKGDGGLADLMCEHAMKPGIR